jgi:hypothetical protein
MMPEAQQEVVVSPSPEATSRLRRFAPLIVLAAAMALVFAM